MCVCVCVYVAVVLSVSVILFVCEGFASVIHILNKKKESEHILFSVISQKVLILRQILYQTNQYSIPRGLV